MPIAKLSDLVNFNNGKTHNFVENGTVPIYSIGKMEGYTDKSICDKPCIAIGMAGTIGKPRLYKPPYWITGTQIYLTAKQGVDLDYIYSVLSDIDWKYYTLRYAIPPKLSDDELKNTDIEIPDLYQQQSIGKLFNLYLKEIDLTKQLIESHEKLKKGLFYRMFGDPDLWQGDKFRVKAEDLYLIES